jgi:CheY-like chemotaxis protein
MDQPAQSRVPASYVLVVDDNEDGAEVLAMLLEDEGHRAQTALSGTRALELADQERPDVVILDLGLPDMDGFALASEMRRRFGPQLRLVAFTGYSSAAHREQAERSGIDSFLTKPLSPATLMKMLAGNASPRQGR